MWSGITGYVLGTGEVSCFGEGEGRSYHPVGAFGQEAPAAQLGSVLTVVYDPARGTLEFLLDGLPPAAAPPPPPPRTAPPPQPTVPPTVARSLVLLLLTLLLAGRALGVACRGLAPPLVAAIAIDARATFTLVE